MTAWIDSVNSLLSMDDTPDERIIALVPAGIMDAALILGSTLATTLETAQDELWKAAVTHFIAARIIISSRKLVYGQGFPDSNSSGTQWGDGSERPSDLLQLRAMADSFQKKALQICQNLLENQASAEAEPRWYDV